MSRNSPRPPSTIREVECQQCKTKFAAFRKHATYCSPRCRVEANRQRKDTSGREAILREFHHLCVVCPEPEDGVKLFVRFHPLFGSRVPLCGTHNSQLSNQMFYERVPPADRVRYKLKKRISTAQKNEAEMRERLEKR
jgi:hypothetical protein